MGWGRATKGKERGEEGRGEERRKGEGKGEEGRGKRIWEWIFEIRKKSAFLR